jgi:protein O-mannosyl-transferase
MLSSPFYSKLIAGLLLVIVTLIVFSPAARHGFINYDDDRYVTDNPQVRAGLQWSTISWAFTTFEQANWHPLTWLSHALDCQLVHLNPTGHHVTSLLLHSLNAVLLFLILEWFTGYTGRSLMVAALFAVHPLNVEAVAWVAERKSVLSMLFFLLAIAAYGWYAKKPAIARYLLVAGLFAAGLMSKPMVITLPFVLLLLDYWPLDRIPRSPGLASGDELPGSAHRFAAQTESIVRLCLEKIPLLLLSAASAGMTMMVQRAGGAVVSSARASLLLRIENALVSYGLYLEKMIWPSRLAVLYAYPHALPMWEVAAASIFLVAVTWAVFRYRRSRYLAMGWFWYLGTMVPMIGLVQVGNQAMADRYAYLPLIGVFLMTVWGVADCAAARRIETKYLAALGCAVVVALSSTTRIQLTYWQDDFTLWTHALGINPHNFVAENNLGFALIRQGKRDAAIAHFRTAAELEPADPTSQFNLGIYAQEQGDLPQATARYEAVLQLTSDTQLRASAFANLGTIYFQLRDYARAKQYFEASVKLNRAFPTVIQDLGLIAQKNGDSGETIRYFAWLVSIAPNDVDYFLLAQAFRQAGREADARWAYQQAVRLSHDIDQTRQAALRLQAQ